MDLTRVLAWLLVSALMFGCASTRAPSVSTQSLPQKTISGRIAQDSLWEGEILIEGDVLVPPQVQLRIAPGTKVRIRAAESTRIDPEYLSPLTEILVRGRLQVEGREGNPVEFVPEKPLEGGEPAWAGILFDRSKPSQVSHARIEGAEAGVQVTDGSPGIENSTIHGCRYGILVQGQASPSIRGNLVEKGEGGIFCWMGASPSLEENRIRDNGEEGLFIDGLSRPTLRENRISGNDTGMAAAGKEWIGDTVIEDNRRNFVLLPSGRRP